MEECAKFYWANANRMRMSLVFHQRIRYWDLLALIQASCHPEKAEKCVWTLLPWAHCFSLSDSLFLIIGSKSRKFPTFSCFIPNSSIPWIKVGGQSSCHTMSRFCWSCLPYADHLYGIIVGITVHNGKYPYNLPLVMRRRVVNIIIMDTTSPLSTHGTALWHRQCVNGFPTQTSCWRSICPMSCVTYIDLGLEDLNSGYSFYVVRVTRTNSLQKWSTMQHPSPLVFICCSTILPRPQCHKSDHRVNSQLFFWVFLSKGRQWMTW